MNKVLKRIVWIILAIPPAYLAIAWKKMPEKVSMHFDWSGKPDRFGARQELIWMILLSTVVSAVVYLILTNIYRIDPKKYAAENKSRLERLAFGVTVFMSTVLCMIIYSAGHGNVKFSTGIILAAMGLLFAFIGNYMPNIKPNYFAGFRLPWTLENEDNWKKTHILVGKLLFGGGLSLALLCIFLPPKAAIVIFTTVMVIITLIPIIYSYRLFLRQKHSAAAK
jgi:uncharacterized membrane protein